MMTLFKFVYLLAITLLSCTLLYAEDVGYRPSNRPMTEEEWRNEHQYEGRNSGGWRHGNWNGGVDTGQHPKGVWGSDSGPQPYIQGHINGNETQYYDPNYYNEHPYDNDVLYDENEYTE